MTAMTNAQAALQAAAAVHSGRGNYARPVDVKLLAETLLNWLDHQEAARD